MRESPIRNDPGFRHSASKTRVNALERPSALAWDQSRNSSLIDVLERVFSSTRLTITAQ